MRSHREHKSNILLNYVTIFILIAIYTLTARIPRHIIELSGELVFFSMMYNVVFHFFFGISLVACFTFNGHFFSRAVSNLDGEKWQTLLIGVAKVTAVTVVSDAINLIFSDSLGHYAPLLNVATVALGWVCIYYLLVPHDKNIFLRIKTFIPILLLTFFAFIISSMLIYPSIIEMDETAIKFTEGSIHYKNLLSNHNLICALIITAFDLWIGMSLMIIHAVSNTMPSNNDDKDTRSKAKKIYDTSVKLTVLIWILVALAAVKIVLLPINSPAGISSLKMNKAEVTAGFADNTYIRIYEISDYIDGEFIESKLYVRSESNLCFDGNVLLKIDHQFTQGTEIDIGYFVPADAPLPKPEDNKNTIIFRGDSTEYLSKGTVDGKEVNTSGICANQVIFFIENDMPVVIRLDDLDSVEENEKINHILKTVLDDGDIAVFEYAAKYFLKYDPKYISAYIARYSQGNFTERELLYLEHLGIRKDYIINCTNNIK